MQISQARHGKNKMSTIIILQINKCPHFSREICSNSLQPGYDFVQNGLAMFSTCMSELCLCNQQSSSSLSPLIQYFEYNINRTVVGMPMINDFCFCVIFLRTKFFLISLYSLYISRYKMTMKNLQTLSKSKMTAKSQFPMLHEILKQFKMKKTSTY